MGGVVPILDPVWASVGLEVTLANIVVDVRGSGPRRW